MTIFSKKPRFLFFLFPVLGLAVLAGMVPQALAQQSSPLQVINRPLPDELRNRVHSGPSAVPEISPRDVLGPSYYQEGQVTVVGKKVNEMRNDLFTLQDKVSELAARLSRLEQEGQRLAAEYYASVATISTQLQAGTTPGNPRLVAKLNTARANLEQLSANIADLNDLAVEISNAASMGAYLLESIHTTYSLSGAIEEDHMRLAQLEDASNSAIVTVDRLLNNVNADINRTVAYLATERENLQTLALAINSGDLFGRSLTNRSLLAPQTARAAVPPSPDMAPPVMPREDFGADFGTDAAPVFPPTKPLPGMQMDSAPLAQERRPLVKIRFDRANVAYEQPVYMAIHEALNRYPEARFEVVGVHPSRGNAAEVAIASTRARRNAEKVKRSLTQMGLDDDRIELTFAPSIDAVTSEVHVFVR